MCGRRHASPSIIDTDKRDNREFGLIKTVHALMIHSHAPTATQKKPTCQVVHDERPHDAYVWCLPFQSAAPLPCHTLTTHTRHSRRDACHANNTEEKKQTAYTTVRSLLRPADKRVASPKAHTHKPAQSSATATTIQSRQAASQLSLEYSK